MGLSYYNTQRHLRFGPHQYVGIVAPMQQDIITNDQRKGWGCREYLLMLSGAATLMCSSFYQSFPTLL